MNTVSTGNGSINSNQISPTNYLYPYKQPTGAKNEPQPEVNNKPSSDKISIDRDLIADLKVNKEKSAVGTILEGSINSSPAALKVVSNNNGEEWIEGALNKKYLLVHCNGKNYDGKYGDVDFNFTIDYNEPSKLSEFFNQKLRGKIFMPDYFTLKGKFGDKVIDVTLPNSKVPEDKEVRDLLTLMLEDNGLKAQIISGEVKSIKFANSEIKNIKKRIEKRKEVINNDIKPIFMQGLSTASGMIIGAVVSALLLKAGIKH